MATVRLSVGPSSVSSASRADRVVLDWYVSVDLGHGPEAHSSDGYIVARSGMPDTADGWRHHLRGATARHSRAPRCPVVRIDDREVALRWADATVKPGGFDYRSGAVMTWEV